VLHKVFFDFFKMNGDHSWIEIALQLQFDLSLDISEEM